MRLGYSQRTRGECKCNSGVVGPKDANPDLRFLEEAEIAVNRSSESFEKMTDAAGMLESPAADPDQLLSGRKDAVAQWANSD
jgi:hypothetical protein